jgi:hypothetical protein
MISINRDVIDAHTGLNQLSDHWLLAYMYLNPGENFGKRYLVFRPVDISWGRTPVEPQVGEMLTHWYHKAEHDHWATTAPVPGNWAAYRMVSQLGYMMTAPDSKEASRTGRVRQPGVRPSGSHLDSKRCLRNRGLQTPAQRRIRLLRRPAQYTALIPLLLRHRKIPLRRQPR